MAFNLITKGKFTPGGVLGGTINAGTTTGADVIVVLCSAVFPSALAISDGLGSIGGSPLNTWNALTAQDYSTGHTVHTFGWYATAHDGGFTVGANHNIEVTGGSNSQIAFAVAAYSGSKTSATPLDRQGGVASVVNNNQTTSSITPTANGCLLVTFSTDDTALSSSVSISDGTTLTMREQVSPVGGSCNSAEYADGTQATAGAVTATWNSSNGVCGVAAVLISFLPGSGGGGGFVAGAAQATHLVGGVF